MATSELTALGPTTDPSRKLDMETSRCLCARVASDKQKETTYGCVPIHSQLLKVTEDDAE